jgi:hypothetical protein
MIIYFSLQIAYLYGSTLSDCNPMITRNTVLILGAGASAPFGYPTGQALVTSIVQNPGNIKTQMTTLYGPELTESFRRSLEFAGVETIDRFLSNRKDFSEIGKFAIAAMLSSCETLGPLFGNNQNWYKKLFGIMTADGRFQDNKLKILTFNYDRSLETFFSISLENLLGVPRMQAVSIASQIPIIHLHGTIASYPTPTLDVDSDYHTKHHPNVISRRAGGIRIIDEVGEEDPDHQMAERILGEAERAIFLGFGYHSQLLRNLKINASHQERRTAWGGTIQGMNPQVMASVNSQFFKGTLQAKDMNCYKFLDEHLGWFT